MNGLEITSAPGTWVWCLGDGLDGGQTCRMTVAVRRAFRGDPAASLALGEIMPVGLVDDPQVRQMDADGRARFERLSEAVGRQGYFVRANTRHKPAARFAYEIERYGGRWPLPHSAAVGRNEVARLPLFFTCPLPLFRDEEQRAVALGLVGELLFATGRLEASWSRPEWGLKPADDHGGDHYLAAVLRLLERLRDEWGLLMQEREPWRRAHRFFKTVRFIEQVFGVTWVKEVAGG